MKRRTGLRSVSPKQSKRLSEYAKLKADMLRFWTYCEAKITGCWHKATDVHHKNGRSGKNLCDTKTWMYVCRPCHDYIETHKREARKKGWITYK